MNANVQRRMERMATAIQDAPEVAWKEPPSWLPPTFHALAYRDYLLLFIGQISNSLAMWMDLVARPVLVVALTGSEVQLGLIALVRGVPMMFLGPIGGLVSDRFDRRIVMLFSKSLSMAVNVTFAAIIVTGNLELWHIYATAILRSLLMAFDGPARHALLPSLVPPKLLMNGIALNTGSMQLVRILSASVAGFFIAFWAFAFGYEVDDARSFGGVYVVTALAYVMAVTATYMMKVPMEGRVERARDSWAGGLVSGFRFAGHNPVILGLLALFAVQSLFGMPYLQVFVPWLALKVMDLGARGSWRTPGDFRDWIPGGRARPCHPWLKAAVSRHNNHSRPGRLRLSSGRAGTHLSSAPGGYPRALRAGAACDNDNNCWAGPDRYDDHEDLGAHGGYPK